MSDKPKNLSDIDSFWDLNSLLPKKRPVSPAPRQPNTDTALIDIGGNAESDSGTPIPKRPEGGISVSSGAHNTARRLNELSMKERAQEYRSKPLDPYLIYTPKEGLIRRVEVSRWDSHYNFYESFRKDAERLFSRTSSECPHVSFFSYIPQYSQLKYSQLKWYLWWRDNVRRGVYMRTDFCYILLYIYEIINCPDLIEPERGLTLLSEIWLNYREEHRRIDSYMCEWLCDYCLINRLPCPTDKLEPILGDVVAAASLKEFYIDTADKNSAGAGILAHSSLYDWRKSRYVTSETLPIFAAHIKGAFEHVYREILSGDGGEFAKEIRVERNAYDGALCVYDIKRTLAVEYVSYTRSPKFRFVVTDIIKYSENRIRMALGIKSRLKADELTDRLRASIDSYFDEHLPIPKKAKKARVDQDAASKEYERLYEPTSVTLSPENAFRIEAESWSTTELLTSAFDDAEAALPKEEPMLMPIPAVPAFEEVPEALQSNSGEGEFESLICALGSAEKMALKHLAEGNTDGVTTAAKSTGMLPDALADRINEAAFDIVGDSIIEPHEGGYRLISDYEGDIVKWLK